MTIIRLKAILFDIVSEGMEVENNKSDIVANIFTKSKDLLQEINKLSLDDKVLNSSNDINTKITNSPKVVTPEETINKQQEIEEPPVQKQEIEDKSIPKQEIVQPKPVEEVKEPVEKTSTEEPVEAPVANNEQVKVAPPQQEVPKEETKPVETPIEVKEEVESEDQANDQSLVLPDLPPIPENTNVNNDKKDNIVFDNNDVHPEEAIANDVPTAETTPNQQADANAYPKVSLVKDTDDPPRAIIVTLSQFQKLQASKIRQKNIIIDNELSEETEVEAEEAIANKGEESSEELPVINIDNNIVDIKDITGIEENNTEASEEQIAPIITESDPIATPEAETEENIIEDSTNDVISEEPEEDIEQMLERANNLYKEGKIEESQALYEKISTLNKENQEKNKTYVKAA